MESLIHQLAAPVLTGLCTMIGCFVVTRTDMMWVKDKLRKHDELLWELKGAVTSNVKRK